MAAVCCFVVERDAAFFLRAAAFFLRAADFLAARFFGADVVVVIVGVPDGSVVAGSVRVRA